ncbi:putative metalloprotease with PDZ domain [Prolixibacter denitrificans]|nr:putative metalloprotease with PDZ domain [Prolixibacter denitrificans]
MILSGFALSTHFAEANVILVPHNGSHSVQKPNNSPDQYRLEFSETTPKLVKIEAQITLKDSLLKMSDNGPMPYRWPQYIHDLCAYVKNGKQLKLHKRDSTAWIVNNVHKGQEIIIRYHVLIDHEKQNWPGGIDGVAFVRDWGITASGRSLFIINGDVKTDIEVLFKKPDDWEISTPWESVDPENTTYMVANQTQLLESFIVAGTQQEVKIARDEFNLNFVLGGDTIAKNKEHYVDAANKILDYYINLMGGLPKNSSGGKLSNVLVVINQSKEMDGEVIGDNISLFLNPEAAPQEQIISWFLFAHEFFHLWNGKSIRFKDTRTDWFKEGITNYYTLKALYNAKLVNEEAIKGVLNQLFYKRYINDKGLGKIAPADAASGFDKDNHWGLVYGGGLFAGICIDMQIRHNTENAHSLDNLMQFFYKETAGTDTLIGNQDILNQANLLAHTDFTGFMNAYINGTDEVPLNKYLEFAGIQASTNNKQLRLIHELGKTDLQQKLWRGFLGLN